MIRFLRRLFGPKRWVLVLRKPDGSVAVRAPGSQSRFYEVVQDTAARVQNSEIRRWGTPSDIAIEDMTTGELVSPKQYAEMVEAGQA